MKARDLAWPAVASGGRAHLEDEAAYRKWFAQTYGDGEELQVIVRKAPTPGSQAQAGYYFGVVLGTLAKALGYDDTYELHISLMSKFRPRVRADGSGLTDRDRWRDYDLNQRTDYVSDVITWAEQIPIRIPLPNEVADDAA